jgi:hypothetical protein
LGKQKVCFRPSDRHHARTSPRPRHAAVRQLSPRADTMIRHRFGTVPLKVSGWSYWGTERPSSGTCGCRDQPMPMWLRLTGHFGAPYVGSGNAILDALGPILRADGDHVVGAPLPTHFRQLLDQLERGDRRTTRARARVRVSQIPMQGIRSPIHPPATAA